MDHPVVIDTTTFDLDLPSSWGHFLNTVFEIKSGFVVFALLAEQRLESQSSPSCLARAYLQGN